jgi:hypothetical protein
MFFTKGTGNGVASKHFSGCAARYSLLELTEKSATGKAAMGAPAIFAAA